MYRKVKFDTSRNKMYNMVVWNYAYREARKGRWEIKALDRFRFQRRIQSVGVVILNILDQKHRHRIYMERFS